MGDRKLEQQLLGYLVGALDEREEDRLKRRLARDPGLSAVLTELEERLEPLRTAPRVHAPPPGLAARTCQRVFAFSQAMAAKESEGAASRLQQRKRCLAMSPVPAPPVTTAAWGWSDVVVAVGVFLAIAGLLFPAIHRSRVNMRLMACQNNLRQFGLMHAQFDNASPAAFVHPAVVNPWITVEVPHQSVARLTGGVLGQPPQPLNTAHFSSSSQSLDQPLVCESSPHGNDFRQYAGPVSDGSAIARPAEAVCSMPHPGLRQLVVGRNLLLPDGQVSFVVVGPLVDPVATAPGMPAPPVATSLPGGLAPNDGQAGFVPIVLFTH